MSDAALAEGPFEVEISPEEADESDGTTVGRMSLLKVFHGDLEGASRGTMLTATTSVDGSAGYVAIERVDGELDGRSGTFLLQHSGVMSGGEQSLTVLVVPDSGTGELEGIAGEMEIIIGEDGHRYQLRYTLA